MRETRHATGHHGFPSFKTATNTGPLRWLVCIASVFVVLIPAPVNADTWSLLLNGKAIHLEKPAGTHYNEENWGLGIQYDFKRQDSKWIPFLTASGFKDSNGNPSYYAGGGTMRRFSFTGEKDSVHLDAGLVVFLMTRKYYLHGDPFLGALPVVSLGTDRLALNVTYIPKVDPKLVPIIFFQIKVGVF